MEIQWIIIDCVVVLLGAFGHCLCKSAVNILKMYFDRVHGTAYGAMMWEKANQIERQKNCERVRMFTQRNA